MPSVFVTVALLIAAILAGPSPATAGSPSIRPSRAQAAELAAEAHALGLYPLAAASEFERLCGWQLDPPSTQEDRRGIARRRTEALEAVEAQKRRHISFDRQVYRQVLSAALAKQRQAAAKLLGEIVAEGGCTDPRLQTAQASFRRYASPAQSEADGLSASGGEQADPSTRRAIVRQPSYSTPLGGTEPSPP